MCVPLISRQHPSASGDSILFTVLSFIFRKDVIAQVDLNNSPQTGSHQWMEMYPGCQMYHWSLDFTQLGHVTSTEEKARSSPPQQFSFSSALTRNWPTCHLHLPSALDPWALRLNSSKGFFVEHFTVNVKLPAQSTCLLFYYATLLFVCDDQC